MILRKIYLGTLSQNIIKYGFSIIKRSDPLMLFASHPVGFPMLKQLHNNFDKIYVVTHYSDSKKIKQNQVQKYCKSNNIQCFCPVKKEQTKQERIQHWRGFVQQIKNAQIKYKLAVACSYGYMIPETVLNLFQQGMILAHPSLIPKYRGGSPIFHAIANGQKESGASFMQVSPDKFDQGNLLYQVKHELGQKDSYQKVQKQLSELMASNIMNVINNIRQLKPGKNQKDMDVSGIPPHQLSAKIYRQKKLNLNMKAEQVYNWSRAMVNPRVKFKDMQIILFFDKEFVQDDKKQYKVGQAVLRGKKLYVKCSDKLLRITGWQQITKMQLPIHTFINRFINKATYKNQIVFQ